MPTNIAVMIQPELYAQLFKPSATARLNVLGAVFEQESPTKPTVDVARDLLAEADICINSWGSVKFDADLLDAAPRLKLIVYAAGSIKPFATDAMWDRGIRVTSAAWAIAHQVAEFVTGLLILSLRNAFHCNELMHRSERARDLPRKMTYGSTVGIVSLGQVGRQVARAIKPFGVDILAYDPFATDQQARELGVKLVDLDTLLRESDAVTLHAPALPETQDMIGKRELALMKDGTVLINTSRGAVVDESALAAELKSERLFACLDVTKKEPPPPDSPLLGLRNCFLTPHAAGGPTFRIGEQCVDEVQRFIEGREQIFEVTREALARMA